MIQYIFFAAVWSLTSNFSQGSRASKYCNATFTYNSYGSHFVSRLFTKHLKSNLNTNVLVGGENIKFHMTNSVTMFT